MTCPRSLFLEVDLVQAEWVVTAYFARDARMIEVIKTGSDPHTRTGSLISNAPEEIVILENEHVGHLTDPSDIAKARALIKWPYHESSWFFPRTMSIRQAGKKSNHGLNYGMRYKRFALENEMEESEARRIVDKYHKAYTGLKDMYGAIEHKLRKDRTLVNCFGSKRKFRDRWGPELLLSAYSFIPQSTVKDVTNTGLHGIYHDPKLRRVELLAHIHDEGVIQVFPRSWDELDYLIRRCVRHFTVPCSYHGEEFILKRELKLGRNLGHMITFNQDEDLRGVWGRVCQEAK